MKRDWDLLREQLIAIEEDSDFKKDVLGAIPTQPEWLDDQSEQEYLKALADYRKIEQRVFGHLELLVNNGFVEGLNIGRDSGGFHFSIFHPRLTMAGHDLLDTMRSKTLWTQIKSMARDKSLELSFDVIKSLGAVALKSMLG